MSRKTADEKVNQEYVKYQTEHHEITPADAPVDEDYYRTLIRDVKRA